MLLRLLEWILFGGVVGSIPLLADGMVLYWQRSFEWNAFLAKGDALLVGAVLCGTAIGRLILYGSKYKGPQLAATCACVVAMTISAWQYAALHYTLGQNYGIGGTSDPALAALASGFVLVLYLFAIVSGAVAAAISR